MAEGAACAAPSRPSPGAARGRGLRRELDLLEGRRAARQAQLGLVDLAARRQRGGPARRVLAVVVALVLVLIVGAVVVAVVAQAVVVLVTTRLVDLQGQVMALLPAVGDAVVVAIAGGGRAGQHGEEGDGERGERGGLELGHAGPPGGIGRAGPLL